MASVASDPLSFQGNMFFTVESREIVRARTHCKLLTISKGDFMSILQHFPKGQPLPLNSGLSRNLSS